MKVKPTMMGRYSALTVEVPMLDENNWTVMRDQKVILFEDDLDGQLTVSLVKQLKAANNQVVVINNNLKPAKQIILNKMDEALEMLGGLDAIIHLQSVSDYKGMKNYSYQEWQNKVERVYNTLFYSAKAAYDYLKNGACYFGVTNIGGVFGIEKRENINPLGGLVAGMIKALEKELRPLNCKVIDFEEICEETATTIFKEISFSEEFIEVGYTGTKRKKVIVGPNQIVKEQKALEVKHSDVILATGGGRGIIYECMKKLAACSGAEVVLTGRTELPSGDERWLMMTEAEFENYRTMFLAEQKRKNPELSAVQILGRYRKMANARELYENIDRLKRQGIKVQYFKCDFACENDVSHLRDELKRQNIAVTGIVNGAGLPSFGKIPHKNEEMAWQVVKTKADSTYLLERFFESEQLKFIVHMGSISGRFGMDGQVDYSAAADLLVKMSKEWSFNQKIKSLVIGWPAWDEVGMASSKEVVRVQKEERGLSYMSVMEGTEHFIDEIKFGSSGTEYLYFNQLGKDNMPKGQLDYVSLTDQHYLSLLDEHQFVLDRRNFSMIDRVVSWGKSEIEATRVLNEQDDLHIAEHCVSGTKVLAGVFHVELAAQLTDLFLKLHGKEDYKIIETKDFHFDQFIKYYSDKPCCLKISGEVVSTDNADEIQLKITLKSDFLTKDGVVLQQDRIHSHGIIRAAREYPVDEQLAKPEVSNMQAIDIDRYYQLSDSYIHFGEHFREVTQANFIEKDLLMGEVVAQQEGAVFGFNQDVQLQIAPIAVDNFGRFMLFNEFHFYGYSVVPVLINRAVKLKPIRPGQKLFVHCKKNQTINEKLVSYHATAYDETGKAVFHIEDMQLTKVEKIKGEHQIVSRESKPVMSDAK